MIELINGEKYDTSSATLICRLDPNDGKMLIDLYVNKYNAFFIHTISVGNDGEANETIEPRSKEQAIEIISKNADGISKFESLFGEFPEAGSITKTVDTEESLEAKAAESHVAPATEPESSESVVISQQPSAYTRRKLRKACKKGDAATVQSLISQGTLPQQKDMYIALKSRCLPVITAIIASGYIPSEKDICYAILLDDPQLLRLLLPPDSKTKMKTLQEYQCYAVKYDKAAALTYIERIIAERFSR